MEKNLVVFAGGIGGRMLPLTAQTNKVLLNYKGKPILEWCLNPFFKLGIKNVSLLTSHLAEDVEKYAQNSLPKHVRLKIIRGDINLNSRIQLIDPIPQNGILTIHGNIILHFRAIKSFISRVNNFDGDFLMLASKRKENFFSGHPFSFSELGVTKCRLGLPPQQIDSLRCCVGLNYMSHKALSLLRDLPEEMSVPEHLLQHQIINYTEHFTNSRVKHFEGPSDLIL